MKDIDAIFKKYEENDELTDETKLQKEFEDFKMSNYLSNSQKIINRQ